MNASNVLQHSLLTLLASTLCMGCTTPPQQNLSLHSHSIDYGSPLSNKYTCEGKAFGKGMLPELHWSGGADEIVSYAVVFKDLSLVDSNTPDHAYHWAIWDVPSSVTGLPEGLEEAQFPKELAGAQQINGGPTKAHVYLGPCPSWENLCSDGHIPRSNDTYSFTLYAFDKASLQLPDTDKIGNYVRQLDAHFDLLDIEKSELIVTSDARPISAPFCPNIEP